MRVLAAGGLRAEAGVLHGGLGLGARGVARAAGELPPHAHAGLPVAAGSARGCRRRHLRPEVWECLDDEVAKLEQCSDFILKFLN